jgi:hypothetical protein
MVIWVRLVGFLVLGYLCMTRSFAYLGIPQLSIFIGEIVLGAFVLLKPRVVLGTWAASLLRNSPLNSLGLALLVFISYGVWEMWRGVLSGSSIFYTMKFFIFNYYAIFLFLGLWVALRAPDTLPKVLRALAWVNGIYGLLWVVVLKYSGALMPGSTVPMFGQPGGGAVAILGLLCFERNLRAVWPLLALNLMVTLAVQVRAEWLGLAAGMLVWGILTRQLGRVIVMGIIGLVVLGTVELAGIQLPGRTGGSVSLAETVGRAIAPINADLAEHIAPDAKRHVGTADWRKAWWDAIWESVNSTPMLAAFGHGYGFYLLGLLPEEKRGPANTLDTRTPHSAFYYTLGYTGWVGVALFVALQFTIFRTLRRAFRMSGQPIGLVLWVMAIAMACFEESFETPYRAIPFYLLMGLAIAPAFQWREELHAYPARAQLLSVARR